MAALPGPPARESSRRRSCGALGRMVEVKDRFDELELQDRETVFDTNEIYAGKSWAAGCR
jgi:hypothetical protein